MNKLDVGEAQSLARVFGERDVKETILLLLFQEPTSKWDARKRIEKWPKFYRIPESSLYKMVDQLVTDGFLQVVEGSGRRGRGGMVVHDYGLTIKGVFAAGINAYLLFSNPNSPRSLTHSIGAKRLAQNFESNPNWSFIIDFLKWHKERKIDLSHSRVDFAYVGSTLALALLEHPETVTLERFQVLAERMRKFGIPVPEVSSKTVEDFRESASILLSIGKNLPLFLRNVGPSNHKMKEGDN
jgi:hypothetical protein